MLRILAFDPGVNLGVCRIDLDLNTSEVKYIGSELISYDSEIPITSRLIKLRSTIHDRVSSEGCKLIAVESVNRVFGGAKNSNSDALYRIYGYVHEAAFDQNIRVVDIPIGTVKSVFAKDGKAKKSAIVAEAKRFTGEPINNDNQADAIAIGYTLARLIGESLLTEQKGKESDFRRNIRTLASYLKKSTDHGR